MKTIKINVGGTVFETYIDTLKKSEYFKSMLEDCSQQTDMIFVDRSAHKFEHVLSFLRDDTYPYPKNMSLN